MSCAEMLLVAARVALRCGGGAPGVPFISAPAEVHMGRASDIFLSNFNYPKFKKIGKCCRFQKALRAFPQTTVREPDARRAEKTR
jgi:hypothetical protein